MSASGPEADLSSVLERHAPLQAAVRWFDDNEVPLVERLEHGKMEDGAFIKDQDGHWVVHPDLLANLGRTAT
jgi:lactoylglutathione lyase